MYVYSRFEKISNVPDSDIFLFQVPVYGMVLRQVSERETFKIDPDDVLRACGSTCF